MKTDKLAEEIADKYSHFGELLNGDACIVLEYTDVCKAMEAYHKSKMAEITDEEIEKWARANSLSSITEQAMIKGAKAFKNGEIKHT